MPPNPDRKNSPSVVLEPKTALKLLNRIGHVIQAARDKQSIFSETSRLLGTTLSIDRCVLLTTLGLEDERESCVLSLSAEFPTDGSKLRKTYSLERQSELYRMLLGGKPVPLSDIIYPTSADLNLDSLENLVLDAQLSFEADTTDGAQVRGAVVAFPLIDDGCLRGVLTLHRYHDANGFCEEILELGEAVSDELTMSLARIDVSSGLSDDAGVFKKVSVPALVVDSGGRIRRYNEFCHGLFAHSRKDCAGLSIMELIPDGQRVLEGLRNLSAVKSAIALGNLLISYSENKSVYMDACLSLIPDEKGDVLMILHPVAEKNRTGDSQPTAFVTVAQSEELSHNLSRQLSWERWIRQIICKLHSSLDRDTLLQTVVDGFGRALGASRCLIVRTDNGAAPLVTHEYAEPDISPLGLGRTGQFPTAAISYFRYKVAAISDLTDLEKSGELSPDEYEYFLDNGIRSMAGSPISAHGIKYGVIIILESSAARKWTNHELDMLEIAATQTAVALGHSQQYLQLKDQLFNMNLLGNLTQQLTNTLELVSRTGRSDSAEEKRAPGTLPPLSLRELEVLKLIASGLANREIAQRLFLTESTVELHASRIRKKLKLKSRTALVKYACDNGLA